MAEGDPGAELALDVYCYRLRKYVGAYYAALGTVDAIAFTGGVGENVPRGARAAASRGSTGWASWSTRGCNRADQPGPRHISPPDGEVAVLVVPTNEEWQIAREALEIVR